MGYLIRLAFAVFSFTWVVVPGLIQFGLFFPFPYATLYEKTSDFIFLINPYIASVKGAINYLIASGVGQGGITAFNLLIKIGLLFPVFALTYRLTVSIRKFFI